MEINQTDRAGRTTLGWVIRTANWLITYAGSTYVEYTLDVDRAELLAISSSLPIVPLLIENLRIFSDSLHAIDLIASESPFTHHLATTDLYAIWNWAVCIGHLFLFLFFG
ncbi:hypothetical protein Sjap_016442 [Stephania japonica]|uniref:RNase H type-1 domain-containing protein n=1 Tax=Stephania japonica TaxID=461633 RepID=A0AAP0ILY5_9MAGN